MGLKYVYGLYVPLLDERKDDIPLLAEYFCRKFREEHVKGITLSDGAMHVLVSRSWPGNVRELSNVIERAVIRYGHVITNQGKEVAFAVEPFATTGSGVVLESGLPIISDPSKGYPIGHTKELSKDDLMTLLKPSGSTGMNSVPTFRETAQIIQGRDSKEFYQLDGGAVKIDCIYDGDTLQIKLPAG